MFIRIDLCNIYIATKTYVRILVRLVYKYLPSLEGHII